MNKTIQHQIYYSQPPQDVWNYLTQSELLEQWLMKNDFQPIVGLDFHFWTRPMPNFGFDGTIYCKVLEIVPLKKLSYSWKGGPGNGKITLDSIVTWTLEAKDSGTSLLLEHHGFKEADFTMFSIMNEGWLKNIHRIADLLNNLQHDPAQS